jgi:hypothetical protein
MQQKISSTVTRHAAGLKDAKPNIGRMGAWATELFICYQQPTAPP